MLRKSLLLALLLPLLACASTVVPEDFPASCSGLYDAYAAWSRACAGPVLDATSRDDLVARCEARAALPGIRVSSAALGACAQQVAASSCAALPLACLSVRDPEYPGLPTDVWLGDTSSGRYELFPRVTGTLAAGASCDLGEQCQSVRCTSSSAACGICVDVRRPGEACGATAVCEYRSDCTSGVCVPWGDGPGAACQGGKGTSCRQDLQCEDGICAPRHQVGEACVGDCVEGALCSHGVCQAIVTVAVGEDCDWADLCEEGTFCVSGECRGPELGVGLGDWCTIDICSEGLVCYRSACQLAAPAGAACSLGTLEVPCAAGLTCFHDAGGRVCGAPRTEGGACTEATDCAGGFFCSGGDAEGSVKACHRELSVGEACASGPCRVSLVCSGGVCVEMGVCSMP